MFGRLLRGRIDNEKIMRAVIQRVTRCSVAIDGELHSSIGHGLMVLVAVEEREGCYLFKEMTCLPEEVDSEYQAVFKEMETTCGIEVSVMEDLGRHSQ